MLVGRLQHGLQQRGRFGADPAADDVDPALVAFETDAVAVFRLAVGTEVEQHAAGLAHAHVPRIGHVAVALLRDEAPPLAVTVHGRCPA